MIETLKETTVQQTIREHEELRRRMSAIREMVVAGGAAAAGGRGTVAGERGTAAAAAARVVAALEDLRKRLAAHFTFEERTGLPEELALRLPHVSGKALVLRRDHVRILDELSSLIAAGPAAAGRAATGRAQTAAGAEEEARFDARVLDLIDALARHEESETDLIQDAWLDEPGGVD